ncbi:(Fe-S)-binding protein [Nitriliruptor alkaliphilus]|uniref:(Fe-S)-binding protein n=1 Tax=Nitriliruptor alkaliphilus TaxID=427918 RepID=UPI0006977D4D|nr:(Fe-S)-binding protein [Nitriliruptor alkaliphilus]
MTTPRKDAAGPEVAAVADDALHGSYCPKMCTFACPVTSATGRDDAVPWSFHRTVSDLAAGRLPLVPEVAGRLTACSGCLACQVPCTFDQDVPSQVRAGRAAWQAAGAAPSVVGEATRHVAAGRAPTGAALPAAPASDPDADVLVVAGCRDDAQAIAATVDVLRAAGDRVAVEVPSGCCGALLDDLGVPGAGDDARSRLADAVDDRPARVVATDPHCLGSLRAVGLQATDLASHLDGLVTGGRLRFPGGTWDVTWHDPCVLARGEAVTDAPRRVLAAAGAALREPEQHGVHTGCSGAGLAMDQLDPDAADRTAAFRARQLGDGPVVTGCARAQQRLAAAGVDVTDLATALARRLDQDPSRDRWSTP